MIELQTLSLFFKINELDETVSKLNNGLGRNRVNTNNLEFAGQLLQALLCKVYNKMMLHCLVPCALLNGEISQVVRAGKTPKTDSDNYGPAMNSPVFYLETSKIFDFVYVKQYFELEFTPIWVSSR